MILDIFIIFNNENADPILLKTACELALNVFLCFTEKDNDEKMIPYFEKLHNFQHLIVYIGGTSYFELLQKVKLYLDSQNFVTGENFNFISRE